MTREWPQFYLGASPRAGIALVQGSRTLAAFRGRDYVVPDDVVDIALPALRHRVMLHGRGRGRRPNHRRTAAAVDSLGRGAPAVNPLVPLAIAAACAVGRAGLCVVDLSAAGGWCGWLLVPCVVVVRRCCRCRALRAGC